MNENNLEEEIEIIVTENNDSNSDHPNTQIFYESNDDFNCFSDDKLDNFDSCVE